MMMRFVNEPGYTVVKQITGRYVDNKNKPD